jgi:hypothetical protein
VLAEHDVSIPGVIACRMVTVPEWLLESVHLARAAIAVLQWLHTRQ